MKLTRRGRRVVIALYVVAAVVAVAVIGFVPAGWWLR